jgi:hypothetical protein
MMQYYPGQSVELKARFKSTYLFSETGYDEIVIKGTVVKTPSWVEYPAVAIQTGNPDIPLSIVAKRSIIGHNDTEGGIEEIRTWTVGKYLVTRTGDKVSCSCVGFQFRRYCKHSDIHK